MLALETLGKRIATTEDLSSIVHTMKSLSAVSIRQYEQAVEALRHYTRNIELGLQVVLRDEVSLVSDSRKSEGITIAVVFGSDHGLCGSFNQEVAQFARDELRRRNISREDTLFVVAGARAASQLESANERIESILFLPGTVGGLTEIAQSLLLKIDALRAQRQIASVYLFHNLRSKGATAAPQSDRLLPLDRTWLEELAHRRWRWRTVPTFTMDAAPLFAALVRQHLFIRLFHAAAESAASEHATRLRAMQAAERNIEDHLDEMNAAYRRKRQDSITEELLDVVAGFEALTQTAEDDV